MFINQLVFFTFMKEVYAILAIVLISVFVFITASPSTANVVHGYGASKVYGGAWKKIYQNPSMVSQAFADNLQTKRWQNYMYSNLDDWDCSFGTEAEESKYPCIFDKSLNKYCCIVSSETVNLNHYNP